MSDVVIDVKNVTIRFNMASEKIDNLKEYFVKLVKRELLFQELLAVKVHNNGASAFRCNAIQALEGVVAEAQAVARRGRHGRQAAVAFFAVAVGVALRVGLRAERPALAGEAGEPVMTRPSLLSFLIL